MNDREYRMLLQQRTFLNDSVNAKKDGIKNLTTYIERAENTVLKCKMDIKETRLPQVIEELTLKIKSITGGIENAGKEILEITKFMKLEQEQFNKIVIEIEKQKKILAGEYYDEELEIKNEKEKEKFAKK